MEHEAAHPAINRVRLLMLLLGALLGAGALALGAATQSASAAPHDDSGPGSLLGSLTSLVTTIEAPLADTVGGLLGSTVGTVNTVVGTVTQPLVTAVGTTVSGATGALATAVETLPVPLVSGLSPVINTAGGAVVGVLNGTAAAVPDTTTAVSTLVNELLQQQPVSTIVGAVTGAIDTTLDELPGILTPVIPGPDAPAPDSPADTGDNASEPPTEGGTPGCLIPLDSSTAFSGGSGYAMNASAADAADAAIALLPAPSGTPLAPPGTPGNGGPAGWIAAGSSSAASGAGSDGGQLVATLDTDGVLPRPSSLVGTASDTTPPPAPTFDSDTRPD